MNARYLLFVMFAAAVALAVWWLIGHTIQPLNDYLGGL